MILILEVVLLVGFSAMCSGLNIALMALDIADLKRKAALDNVAARRVLPFRRNLHLTLTSILLANVAVISVTSLLIDDHSNGLIAGVVSTLLIVVFGEILPQALFSRRALSYFAYLTPLLWVMIVVTYPVSKPLQLLLDRLFGHESAKLQSRHELGMMITEHLGNDHSELDDDEIEIIRGALTLSEKRVRNIMLDIKKVYWLKPDDIVDAAKIDEIKAKGWSRIPVFNQQRTTCYGILLVKDLVDIDFDEEPRRVDELPLYPSRIVGARTALDTLFRIFITGGTHLLPIERNDKIVGIVAIEDLLEEIVGREIEDETDRRLRTAR